MQTQTQTRSKWLTDAEILWEESLQRIEQQVADLRKKENFLAPTVIEAALADIIRETEVLHYYFSGKEPNEAERTGQH